MKRKYTYSTSTSKARSVSKHEKKVKLKVRRKMDPSFTCILIAWTPKPDLYKICH